MIKRSLFYQSENSKFKKIESILYTYLINNYRTKWITRPWIVTIWSRRTESSKWNLSNPTTLSNCISRPLCKWTNFIPNQKLSAPSFRSSTRLQTSQSSINWMTSSCSFKDRLWFYRKYLHKRKRIKRKHTTFWLNSFKN